MNKAKNTPEENDPTLDQENSENSGKVQETQESDIQTATIFGRQCLILDDPGLEDEGMGKIAIVYWPGISGTRTEEEFMELTNEICETLGVGKVVFSDRNFRPIFWHS